jgi:HEAT repeat protein
LEEKPITLYSGSVKPLRVLHHRWRVQRVLIRLRTGDGAAAGRFIGIEDGVLKLRTTTGQTVSVRIADLDAASVVRYSGVAAPKTDDQAKAAVYYLMRGDPAAARRELGDLEDGKALELRAAIDELSGLLEPAPGAAAPGADAAAATAGSPGSGRPEAEEVSLPPPSLLALREFKKLGSPDEEVRRNAHNRFNNLRDWGMIPAITKALKGGDKERRLWLVYSLPQIRHPTVRACLRDLAANDRDVNVRSAAVRGLETQDAWPAIPDLLGYLARDKNPHVRAAAAHGLGRWRVPEAVKSLMRAMDDADTVRAAAAHSLGRLNVTEAVPVLAKNLNHGESSVRSECARALGEIGGNAATAALLARLRRESPGASSGFTVCQIAASLAKIGGSAAAPGIRRLAKDDNAYVRRSAAKCLGELGDPKAVADLAGMLGDRDASVRSAAKAALAAIGTSGAMKALGRDVPPERAFEGVVRRLRSGTLGERNGAAREIMRYRNAAAAAALVAALKDAEPSVRASALTSAVYCHRPSCYPAVMRLTSDPDENVRSKAVTAAGGLFDPRAVPVLLKILKEDASTVVRAAAARALGLSKDPSVIPALLRAMADDVDVKSSAVTSLGRLRAHEATPLITACLASDNENLRAMSAYALRSLGRRSAIPHLLKALRKEDPKLAPNKSAQAITHSLGQLQAHFAAEEIARFVQSPDMLVRSSAVRALGRIGTEEVVPALAIALDDENSEVRRAAARHLENIGTPEALKALQQAKR